MIPKNGISEIVGELFLLSQAHTGLKISEECKSRRRRSDEREKLGVERG